MPFSRAIGSANTVALDFNPASMVIDLRFTDICRMNQLIAYLKLLGRIPIVDEQIMTANFEAKQYVEADCFKKFNISCFL